MVLATRLVESRIGFSLSGETSHWTSHWTYATTSITQIAIDSFMLILGACFLQRRGDERVKKNC